MTQMVLIPAAFSEGWAKRQGDPVAHYWITVPEGNTGFRFCRSSRVAHVRGRDRTPNLYIAGDEPRCKRCEKRGRGQ